MKYLLTFILFASITFAETLAQLGVDVKVKKNDGKMEEVTIMREIDDKCEELKFSPALVWSEGYASSKVPKPCKVTLVSTIGKISPIKIAKDVETYGELEVLKFIENMQKDKNKLFIDSRTPNWYKQRTIPGAINIPYTTFTKNNKENLDKALKILGVSIENNKLNFSNAKEILLFCNGAWCGQSPISIKKLIKLGYPANKIKWYRGGMHSWLSLSLTTTKERSDLK